MEELGFLWLEEPFYEQELSQYQTLCAELKTMPVMATEMLMYDTTLCAQWLLAGATDLVRVNARNGATGVVKLAHLAELHGTTVEMNAGGGLGGHVHVQLSAPSPRRSSSSTSGGTRGPGRAGSVTSPRWWTGAAALHAARMGGGAGLGLHPLPYGGRVPSAPARWPSTERWGASGRSEGDQLQGPAGGLHLPQDGPRLAPSRKRGWAKCSIRTGRYSTATRRAPWKVWRPTPPPSRVSAENIWSKTKFPWA